MIFRTEVKHLEKAGLIDHNSKLTMLGSCFTENIGAKLYSDGFKPVINPFGILFNPNSIFNLFNCKELEEKHILKSNDSYVSYDYHSSFRADSKSELIDNYNKEINLFKHQIKNTNVLILTFGTAWTYKLKTTNKYISNCQKQPQQLFDKQLLEVDYLKCKYVELFKNLIAENGDIKIVLTVSPVRHIKDGLSENNRSKATLLLLANALELVFKKNVIYYPSYEIQIDDLRDYRFFKRDLIHPNDVAIDYIYHHFLTSFMGEKTKEIIGSFNKYNRLKSHRFMNASENEKIKFNNKIELLKKEIESQLNIKL